MQNPLDTAFEYSVWNQAKVATPAPWQHYPAKSQARHFNLPKTVAKSLNRL